MSPPGRPAAGWLRGLGPALGAGLLLSLLACPDAEGDNYSATFTAGGTFTVPAGVTSVAALVVAGGGGGGSGSNGFGGGGGGGGGVVYDSS